MMKEIINKGAERVIVSENKEQEREFIFSFLQIKLFRLKERIP
jgi:hypothetical protein